MKSIQAIIVATPVLHSIAVDANDENPVIQTLVSHDEEIVYEVHVQNDSGAANRNALITQYFSS